MTITDKKHVYRKYKNTYKSKIRPKDSSHPSIIKYKVVSSALTAGLWRTWSGKSKTKRKSVGPSGTPTLMRYLMRIFHQLHPDIECFSINDRIARTFLLLNIETLSYYTNRSSLIGYIETIDLEGWKPYWESEKCRLLASRCMTNSLLTKESKTLVRRRRWIIKNRTISTVFHWSKIPQNQRHLW